MVKTVGAAERWERATTRSVANLGLAPEPRPKSATALTTPTATVLRRGYDRSEHRPAILSSQVLSPDPALRV